MARKSSRVGQAHVEYKHIRFKTSPMSGEHETASQARNAMRKALEERMAWCVKFESESVESFAKAIGDLRGAPIAELRVGSEWGRSLVAGGMTFVYKITRVA